MAEGFLACGWSRSAEKAGVPLDSVCSDLHPPLGCGANPRGPERAAVRVLLSCNTLENVAQELEATFFNGKPSTGLGLGLGRKLV